MKKIFKVMALVLVIAVALSVVVVTASGCTDNEDVFKIGLICLHDENSTYDANFISAFKATQKKYGLSDDQVLIVTGVPEGDECYQEAAKLADAGCDIVFADSFGHEAYMIKAAKEFPNVQFCHATGTRAHTENLPNYANAFATIYEGRYLAGVAAGMKMNEMIAEGKFTADQAKMGYVAAWPYAEVISGYTSYYLGARSICSSATMEVTYTGSWYDETRENQSANYLIGRDCKIISQHADSMGAPNACETKGVPNVSYNGSTEESCPNTFIISSRIDWSPYYNYVIDQVQAGKPVAADWVGTIENGGVKLTGLGANAPANGTAAKIEEVKTKLINGDIHVFDTNKFTVDGSKLPANFKADVDSDEAYTPDTEVIHKDGYFQESFFRSAPYFSVIIDGITVVETPKPKA